MVLAEIILLLPLSATSILLCIAFCFQRQREMDLLEFYESVDSPIPPENSPFSAAAAAAADQKQRRRRKRAKLD